MPFLKQNRLSQMMREAGYMVVPSQVGPEHIQIRQECLPLVIEPGNQVVGVERVNLVTLLVLKVGEIARVFLCGHFLHILIDPVVNMLLTQRPNNLLEVAILAAAPNKG
jgi:hypothetical protein